MPLSHSSSEIPCESCSAGQVLLSFCGHPQHLLNRSTIPGGTLQPYLSLPHVQGKRGKRGEKYYICICNYGVAQQWAKNYWKLRTDMPDDHTLVFQMKMLCKEGEGTAAGKEASHYSSKSASKSLFTTSCSLRGQLHLGPSCEQSHKNESSSMRLVLLCLNLPNSCTRNTRKKRIGYGKT